MQSISVFILVASLCFFTSCAMPGEPVSDRNVCEEALTIIAECTGERTPPPDEGCVGDYRAGAEEVARGGCAAVDRAEGRADSGFWCWSANLWMGRCRATSLQEAATIPDVDSACSGREDSLCDTLSRADWPLARHLLQDQLTLDRTHALTDHAVQWFLRERVVSLLVYNKLTGLGTAAPPADYPRVATAALREYFPAYDPRQFGMAHDPMVPEVHCSSPQAVLVMFPGVVRVLDRAEFAEQTSALNAALPCLLTVRVDTGSFVAPTTNAAKAKQAIEQLDAIHGELPLHLMGYSQGARNALQTLVEYPRIAERTVSVLTMNSAARGSEVADLLYQLAEAVDREPGCDWASNIVKPACEWASLLSTRPAGYLLDVLSAAMGVPVDELEHFFDAEEGIAPGSTLAEFFRSHLPGIRSLTTADAEEFWQTQATRLPRHTMYMSFRSVVSDREQNLPPSNTLFYSLLRRANGLEPHNDMQVRLVNQSLGGPIADLEVPSPVAEGNHWQWELATGELPETVMPKEMTERIPHRELLVAYYQALAEVGLLR